VDGAILGVVLVGFRDYLRYSFGCKHGGVLCA